MKKNYSKPVISFESFMMSSSIAGTCERDTGTYASIETCVYDFAGDRIFATLGICETTPQDGTDAMICYQNPSDTERIFGS